MITKLIFFYRLKKQQFKPYLKRKYHNLIFKVLNRGSKETLFIDFVNTLFPKEEASFLTRYFIHSIHACKTHNDTVSEHSLFKHFLHLYLDRLDPERIEENLGLRIIDLSFRLKENTYKTREHFFQSLINERQSTIMKSALRKLALKNANYIDVGTHNGEVLSQVLESEPLMKCIAIEPLPSKYQSLKKKFPQVKAINSALSESQGESYIFEYLEESGLSSMSEISQDYNYFTKNFNKSKVVKHKVPVDTLDNIIGKLQGDIILKIDVQGFESKVLQGGLNSFTNKRIKACLIEVSTISKYQKHTSPQEILDFFLNRNFLIFDILPFYRETRNHYTSQPEGILTEFDVLFIDKNSLTSISECSNKNE